MQSHLGRLFEDEETIKRIKGRLPYLFQLLERKVGNYAF